MELVRKDTNRENCKEKLLKTVSAEAVWICDQLSAGNQEDWGGAAGGFSDGFRRQVDQTGPKKHDMRTHDA